MPGQFDEISLSTCPKVCFGVGIHWALSTIWVGTTQIPRALKCLGCSQLSSHMAFFHEDQLGAALYDCAEGLHDFHRSPRV